MTNVKVVVAVVAVVAVAVAGCAVLLSGGGGNDSGGEYVIDWGPGTTMDYSVDGGYILDSSGYAVSYSYDGSTLRDRIIASTSSDFTYDRAVVNKVTHRDPVSGETQTESQSAQVTRTQDRIVKYDSAATSTLDTKWGTKDVLVIKSVAKDDNGNVISITDYRDASTYVRYRADLTCSSYVSDGETLKDWHMSYTLTNYEIK